MTKIYRNFPIFLNFTWFSSFYQYLIQFSLIQWDCWFHLFSLFHWSLHCFYSLISSGFHVSSFVIFHSLQNSNCIFILARCKNHLTYIATEIPSIWSSFALLLLQIYWNNGDSIVILGSNSRDIIHSSSLLSFTTYFNAIIVLSTKLLIEKILSIYLK